MRRYIATALFAGTLLAGLLPAATAAETVSDSLVIDLVTSSADEAEATRALSTYLLSSTIEKDEGATLMEWAMNRGWFDLGAKIFETASAQKVDLSTTMHQTAARIRTKLGGLLDSIQKQGQGNAIAPAFEWAQSPDSILLNVKFSHKTDAPATLGCQATSFQAEGKTMEFKADCPEKKKAFQLSLSLYGSVSSTPVSSFAMASVGRAVITLKKPTNGTWPRLLSSSKIKTSNMHIWWAMSEKLAAENEAWEKKEKEAKADAAAANSTEAEATDAPAATEAPATPVPTPTPTVDPVEEAKKRAREEIEGKRKAELREVSDWEKGAIRTSDAEFRAKKKTAEEAFKAEKKAIDDEADKAREGIRKEAEEKRQAVNAKYEGELAAAPELNKSEL